MNIKDGDIKNIAINMMDNIEQKIDKLTVMMGKLVTEMNDRTDNLNHEFISPIEVEDRQDTIMNREDLRTDLGQTTHTQEDQNMDKIIEVGQDMILIIEVVTDMI